MFVVAINTVDEDLSKEDACENELLLKADNSGNLQSMWKNNTLKKHTF